jgi:hypothetical protein
MDVMSLSYQLRARAPHVKSKERKAPPELGDRCDNRRLRNAFGTSSCQQFVILVRQVAGAFFYTACASCQAV